MTLVTFYRVSNCKNKDIHGYNATYCSLFVIRFHLSTKNEFGFCPTSREMMEVALLVACPPSLVLHPPACITIQQK